MDLRKDEHNIPLEFINSRNLSFSNPGSNSLDGHRSLDDIFVTRCVILIVSSVPLSQRRHTGLTGCWKTPPFLCPEI